jgi:hypothetical protein
MFSWGARRREIMINPSSRPSLLVDLNGITTISSIDLTAGDVTILT